MTKKKELKFDVEMIFGDNAAQKKLVEKLKSLKEGEKIVIKINDGTTEMTKQDGTLFINTTSMTMTGSQMREYNTLLKQVDVAKE